MYTQMQLKVSGLHFVYKWKNKYVWSDQEDDTEKFLANNFFLTQKAGME